MPYNFLQQPAPQWGLAHQANQFMSQQAQLPYMMNLPLYGSMNLQSSRNILDRLKGVVPQDVVNQVQQRAAERGIATGMGPGANTNSAFLRALGLTSLGLQQGAEQEFTGAAARTPVPEIWNPLAMYVPERKAYSELQATQPDAFTWRAPKEQPWWGTVGWRG
jgi:hypothetical protein